MGEYQTMDGEEQIEDDKEAYNLKSEKPFDADTLNTEIMTYRPYTSGWESSNEIVVQVGCTNDHWLDLETMTLHAEFQITRENGTPFTLAVKDQKAFTTSNFVNMIFSRIDFKIDHQKPLLNNMNYGLATSMLRILNLSKKEAEKYNFDEFYSTHIGNPNANYPTQNNDALPDRFKEEFTWRHELIDGSVRANATSNIFHYMTTQGKKLPPGVKFSLVFSRNKAEKMFNWSDDTAANGPKLKFTKFEVKMKRVRLDENATTRRLDSITNKDATIDYPITRYATHTLTLPRLNYVNISPILTGPIPRKVAIGFVRNEAVSDNGNRSYDSLYFENLGVEKIMLKYDNKTYPEEGGYVINQSYTNPQKKIANRKVYIQVMNTWRGDHLDADLTYDKWTNWYNLFTFDLTPNMKAHKSTNYDQMKLVGDLSLEVIFHNRPANDYSVVMLCEYHNTCSIDMSTMTPIFDFSA